MSQPPYHNYPVEGSTGNNQNNQGNGQGQGQGQGYNNYGYSSYQQNRSYGVPPYMPNVANQNQNQNQHQNQSQNHNQQFSQPSALALLTQLQQLQQQVQQQQQQPPPPPQIQQQGPYPTYTPSNSMYPVRIAETTSATIPYLPANNTHAYNSNNGRFKPNNSNKRNRKCYNCKGYGHVSAECPSKRIENDLNSGSSGYKRINHRPDYSIERGLTHSPSISLRCFICNSDQHKVMDCPERKDIPLDPNSCFVCGSLNHKAANCPDRKNDERCFICNSPGHKVANCPQRHPMNDGSGRDGKKGGCFVCNSHAHKAADCPHRNSNKPASNVSDEDEGSNSNENKGIGGGSGFACYICNSKDHKASHCPQRDTSELTCYLCQKKGHISRDCPSKSESTTEDGIPCCWNCKSTEHKARDCPKLCRVCMANDHETAKCPKVKNGYYNLVKLSDKKKESRHDDSAVKASSSPVKNSVQTTPSISKTSITPPTEAEVTDDSGEKKVNEVKEEKKVRFAVGDEQLSNFKQFY